jgi:hypothetical protein
LVGASQVTSTEIISLQLSDLIMTDEGEVFE